MHRLLKTEIENRFPVTSIEKFPLVCPLDRDAMGGSHVGKAWLGFTGCVAATGRNCNWC